MSDETKERNTMEREILIYGLRSGETERYMEELLSTQCKTPAQIESLKARAGADGFHSFRIAFFTPGEKPDFAKTVNT